MRDKISACLTVGNEERNIRRCLESLKWADEIVVVDSFSKDHTVDIARNIPNAYTSTNGGDTWGKKNSSRKMGAPPLDSVH